MCDIMGIQEVCAMLTPEGYKPRLIDLQIDRLMKIYGAVCVEGPKWCGKTWTSRNHAVRIIYRRPRR